MDRIGDETIFRRGSITIIHSVILNYKISMVYSKVNVLVVIREVERSENDSI